MPNLVNDLGGGTIAVPPPPPPPAAPPAAPAPVSTQAQPIPQPGAPLVDTEPGVFIPAPPVVPAQPPPPPPPAATVTPQTQEPTVSTQAQPIPEPGHVLIDVGDGTVIPAPPAVPVDSPTEAQPLPPRVGGPAPVPRLGANGRYTHLQLEQIWELADGLPQFADVAAAVAQAESSGDPKRINNTAHPNRPGYKKPGKGAQPEYSVGLWQINMLAHPTYAEKALLDPLQNAGAAADISNDGGNWSPWSTYTSGAYRQFLTGTKAPAPTPGASAPPSRSNAPPGIQAAWGNLIDEAATHMPKAHAHVKSLADSLIGVFK